MQQLSTEQRSTVDSRRRLTNLTSSSAVAKRPRDASGLSIVSFNSTKRLTESFIISYIRYTDLLLRAIKCCYVVFGVTLKLLVIKISPSFPAINTHTHTQLYSPKHGRYKHRRLLPAKCHKLRHGGPTASYWQHLPVTALTTRSETRYWRVSECVVS